MYSYISNQVALIKGDNHGNEYLRQIEKNVKPFYPKVKPAAVQGQTELKCPLCGRPMRLLHPGFALPRSGLSSEGTDAPTYPASSLQAWN